MHCRKVFFRIKTFNTICSIILLVNSSCAQPGNGSSQQQTMEQAIKTYKNKAMYDKIKSYRSRPLYILQVNKDRCRVLVTCNDIPHWITFYENIGESQGIYLNDYLLSSGEQRVTVEVYPKEGEQYISENANVDVKLKYAEDRDDGVNTYTDMGQYNLPEDIGERKLGSFEIRIPFSAEVPWDISADLETARKLSDIPDIENKVVAKYQEIRNMLVAGDGLSFLKEITESDLRKINSLYFTKEEILADEAYEDTDITISRTDVKNRKVFPIADYEMIFSHHDKLVHLRKKDTKDDIIGVTFDSEEGIGGSQRMILLYIPEGSEELVVW